MAWANVATVAVAGIAASSKKPSSSTGPNPAGLSNSPDFRTSEAVFDNSGWNVSFGQSKIDSTAVKTTDLAGATAPGSGLDMGSGLGQSLGLGTIDSQTLMIGAGALVAVVLLKRKKS